LSTSSDFVVLFEHLVRFRGAFFLTRHAYAVLGVGGVRATKKPDTPFPFSTLWRVDW